MLQVSTVWKDIDLGNIDVHLSLVLKTNAVNVLGRVLSKKVRKKGRELKTELWSSLVFEKIMLK